MCKHAIAGAFLSWWRPQLNKPPLHVRHDAPRQGAIERAVRPVDADAHPATSHADGGELDGGGGDLGAQAKLRMVDRPSLAVAVAGAVPAPAVTVAALHHADVGHQPRELPRLLGHGPHRRLPVRHELEDADHVVPQPGLYIICLPT